MAVQVDLTRVMAYPVHGPTWDPPAGSRDYRITTTFDGVDLINGGTHQAIDLGNFRQGDPVRAPIACQVRGYRHWDGALGVGMRLGGPWVLELWHLDRVDCPLDRWTQVPAGTILGVTGDSGRVFGAHTHAELERLGVRVDPAAYFLGLATLTIDLEDDMRLSGTFVRHTSGTRTALTDGANFRAGVVAGANDPLAVMPAGTAFLPVVEVRGASHGTAADRASWYGGWQWVSAAQAAAVGSTASGWLFGYYHSSVLTRAAGGASVKLEALSVSSSDLDAAYRAGQERMRTRAQGASRAALAALGLEPRP